MNWTESWLVPITIAVVTGLAEFVLLVMAAVVALSLYGHFVGFQACGIGISL